MREQCNPGPILGAGHRLVSDLNSLKDNGVLTYEEYCQEKKNIMDLLKNAKAT